MMDILRQYHLVHTPLGLIHTVFALLAMVAGSYVLIRPKGGNHHRLWGYIYFVLMVGVNVTALGIYTWGKVNLFHFFAVFSLTTNTIGIYHAYSRKSSVWLELHYRFMAWSVVGLYCAFWAEVGTRLFEMRYFWWVVMLLSAGTAAIGGYFIQQKMNAILQKLQVFKSRSKI